MLLTPITMFFHAVFLEGTTPGFFGGLSFFLSEKRSKALHLHQGRLAGQQSSG